VAIKNYDKFGVSGLFDALIHNQVDGSIICVVEYMRHIDHNVRAIRKYAKQKGLESYFHRVMETRMIYREVVYIDFVTADRLTLALCGAEDILVVYL